MATLEKIIADIVQIKKPIEIYLALPKLSAKQMAALRVDLKQLTRNLKALEEYEPPVEATHAVEVPKVDPPPVPAPSNRSSGIFYGSWAQTWFAANFPEGAADADAIVAAAKRDGVLAQVCAGGLLGTPVEKPDLDWSLYTGLTGTTEANEFIFRLWINGVLVGTTRQTDPDGMPWAISLGWDPN